MTQGRTTAQWWSKARVRYAFVLPAVLGIAVVIAFPLAFSFYISFRNYIVSLGGIGEFVGLDNYRYAFTQDLTLSATKNTLVLTFWVVLLEFLIAFGLALLLNRRGLKFKGIYLSILMIPMFMPPIAVGLIWRLLLHPELGIINYALGALGLPQPAWLANTRLAMVTIIMVDIWHETQLLLTILLAGLTALPDEPYEAALVDGANSFQAFRHVTVPLMMPTIVITILIRLIAALKTYDLVYMLTRGGPGTATETISYYIYRVAFVFLDMGKSAAMSFTLLIVIIALTLLFIRTTERAAQQG